MMATLEALRDALAGISGVQSCKIGVEANISPADYPMIRIVPVRMTAGKPYGHRTAELQILFGARLAASQGLENVYSALLALDAAIIEVLRATGAKYLETITDEDRLDAYKLMTIRAELAGAI